MTFLLQPVKNDEPALAGAPMIGAAQKLLAYLAEHDAIGLTKGKAFQRKFVHWAAAEFDWPGWEEDKLFLVDKVLNEYDFPPLEALHFVLLKLKLIRHYKLTCRLTKAGREVAGKSGDLFNLMAMGSAIQGIGSRSKALHVAAMKLAEEIGPIHFDERGKCDPYDVAKNLSHKVIRERLGL